MKIIINTDVLQKHNLSLGQFIVLLTSYYNLDCQKIHDELIEMKLAEKDLFKGFPPVISDNTKNLIARIIVESDDKLQNCGIDDFEELAQELINCYPPGKKPGTTYPLAGNVEEIAQKLRVLIVKHNFIFTEEEAIHAVKEYVSSCENREDMVLLRNFILHNKRTENGYEFSSIFMSYIENYREQKQSAHA